MLISLHWLREFVALQEKEEEIAHTLTQLGLEVEDIVPVGEECRNFFIGKIVELAQHPEKSTLQVARVDIGGTILQIVTAAPNVAENAKVVVALPGSILPQTQEKVEKKQFGTVISEAVLCSRWELGLGDREEDKRGIWILPDTAVVGQNLAEYLKMDDTVLNIALTPNRADCLSHIGIARELAAYYQRELRSPEIVLSERPPDIRTLVNISVREPELCPRYAARIIQNVTIGPSPEWMQRRLIAVGMRPRNVVVDVTNYVMMELGHPLHAFDYDKLAGQKIVVQCAKENERFITLDGKERTLSADMLMICDAEKPIAIAGVMGGENTEITESTQNVLLESAYFLPSSIRKTARKLGLSTESSYRFERGTDIENVLTAVNRAAALIAELAGGTVVQGVYDVYPNPLPPKQIQLRFDRVSHILGVAVEPDRIISILERLGFTLLTRNESTVVVHVPSFRVDIDEEIDLIEEVARFVGYDHIPPLYSSRLVYRSPDLPEYLLPLTDKSKIVRHLVSLGFTEVLTPNMMDPATAQRFTDALVRIANPLGEELSVLRPSLLPAMLRVIDRNVRVQQKSLRLFEIGKVFFQKDMDESILPGYFEEEQLIFAITGDYYPRHWGYTQRPVDFYDAKGILQNIITLLHLEQWEFSPYHHLPFYYTPNALRLLWNDVEIGSVGEVHPEVLKGTEIRQPVYIGQLFVQRIRKIPRRQPYYQEISPFPMVERDLAFLVSEQVPVGEIVKVLKDAGGPYLHRIEVFDVYVDKHRFGEGKKSVAFTLQFLAADHTLTDEEIEQFIAQIVRAVTEQFHAELRRS